MIETERFKYVSLLVWVIVAILVVVVGISAWDAGDVSVVKQRSFNTTNVSKESMLSLVPMKKSESSDASDMIALRSIVSRELLVLSEFDSYLQLKSQRSIAYKKLSRIPEIKNYFLKYYSASGIRSTRESKKSSVIATDFVCHLSLHDNRFLKDVIFRLQRRLRSSVSVSELLRDDFIELVACLIQNNAESIVENGNFGTLLSELDRRFKQEIIKGIEIGLSNQMSYSEIRKYIDRLDLS